jgi:hypothetical protein
MQDMQALQKSGTGIAQVVSAYTSACERLSKARAQEQSAIVEIYKQLNEQDWLFLTSISGLVYYDVTDYQRVTH